MTRSTPPLHVGYVLKRFPRLSETFVLHELLALERRGIRVTVFAMGRPHETVSHRALTSLAAEVRYAPRPATDGALSSRTAPWGRWVAHEAEMRGVDHLHAHFATTATEVAWAAHDTCGIPFSFTAHAKDIYHESVDAGWLARAIDASAFTVTVSEFNRRHLAALAGPGAAARVHRIYNGVDLDAFPFVGGAARVADTVLGVGRFVEKKGFADLVEALALLRDRGRLVRLTLVGDGEQAADLRALASARGLGDLVDFTGPLPQDDVRRLMQTRAVFALPCVVGADGNRDGLPTVILEAMASGLPVVSTDVTGVPEMIADGVTGRIVGQRRPRCLAGAIETLLDAPGAATALARRARARVEATFRLDANVAQLARLFEAAAATRRAWIASSPRLNAAAPRVEA